MGNLQIDFEEGFAGETVVVSAAGRELWRADGVRTNLSAGVAAVATVDVPEGAEVEVRANELSASRLVSAPFLVVSIADEKLALRESDELPLHV